MNAVFLIVSLLAAEPAAECKVDDDCTGTTWHCCACPRMHAISKKALALEEDACAVKKCPQASCPAEPPVAYAPPACKAGRCVLEAKKPRALKKGENCHTADDCEVRVGLAGDADACGCPSAYAVARKAPSRREKERGPHCGSPCPDVEVPKAECFDHVCRVAPHTMK